MSLSGDSEKTLKWINKLEIAEVLDKYFRALDDRHFDVQTMSEIFAAGATVERPNGSVLVGPQLIGEGHKKSFAHFRASQHLASGFAIELQGTGVAQFRANLVAMHLWADGEGDTSVAPQDNYFLAGGVISGEAILGEAGWRISKVKNAITWRTGVGFAAMLQMIPSK
jgi:SnoaL-like domain